MNTALITAMKADFADPLQDDWGETVTIMSATSTWSAGQAAISYATAGTELAILQDRVGMMNEEVIRRNDEGLTDMPLTILFASASSIVNDKAHVILGSSEYRVQKIARYDSHTEVHLKEKGDR